ncbi:MAG: rod shape-determining protein MreD [Bacteroidales bacterium]|jgi:rod shape-determining protein MreD|nr:rod shape-determining protein MreD [Bacteroidales bacterium]
MSKNILIKNLLRFAFLLLLQVLVINHIQISSMVTPYIYILAILMLPFNTPKWLLLVSAFVLGFFMDIFSGTMGLNMASTLLLAFIRPTLLNMISFGREFNSDDSPTMKELGADWFISYALVMILIHHSAMFFLEIFRWDEFGSTLLRILYSSAATFVMVMLSQIFFTFRKD